MKLGKFGLLAGLVCLSLVSCGPRGETKTLDEVLQLAKERFNRVSSVTTGTDAAANIKSLMGMLNSASSMDSASAVQQLTQIADALTALVSHASYTVRPAMTEIINQYRVMAAMNSNGYPSAGQIRLLVARTYGVLASELETAKFGI